MKIIKQIGHLFQIAILLFLCRCATIQPPPTCISDGREYGKVRGVFSENFWCFYERGLSYAEGGCYDAALADLKSAISHSDTDRRKARTYGVEFIDYFPHRELGKIYFETGDLESARKELELSVSQYPSAKARFYLDQVRKTLIKQQRSEIHAPRLDLETLNELRIRDNSVIVSGHAEDENYVSMVKINGIPYLSESSAKQIAFKQAITLSEGENHIEVEAENIFGKKSSKEIIVYSDRQGPVITVEKLSSGNGQIMITGVLYDDAGVSEILVNKQLISIRKDIDTNFSIQVPNTDKIELAAKDSLGNETVMRIAVSPTLGSETQKWLADSGLIMADVSPSDSPRIQLMGGLSDIQTVYQEELYVQAEVSGKSSIRSLKINEKPIVRRQAKMISFGEMIKLNEGENRIVIEASDIEGRISTKELAVIRKIPQAFQLEERLGLAISLFKPEFEDSDKTKKTARDFQSVLEKAFQDNKRFRILRGKSQCQITGRITEGSDLEFYAELIDTESPESEVLVRADVYHQKKTPEILKELAEGMANIFIRKYPMLTGQVLDCEGNQVTTNLGQKQAEDVGGKDARVPKRLIVFRDTPIDKIIGNAQIISARKDKSTAELLKGDPHAVKPNMDKVITR